VSGIGMLRITFGVGSAALTAGNAVKLSDAW